jgi:GT2 family glycosyltransferase
MLTTFNRLSLTQRTFDNFFATTKSPYHLIITDNGSTDGTPEYLKSLKVNEFCLSYDIHLNAENLGIARGRNRGLKIAEKYNAEYLCTMDPDVELPDDWLGKCIDIIGSNPNFVIGVNFEDTTYPPITINNKTFQLKARGNLGSALMVFKKELHNKIGYFYTDWPKPRYAHEDADAGQRMRLAGYKLGYLLENGVHLGVGAEDSGEYRQMKDECSKANLTQFHQNCALYTSGKKSIYIPFNG